MDTPLVPACGVSALADVVPALLSGLGVPGFADRLALHPARGVCLLLVDGLGWQALRAHPQDAPFLTSLTGGSEPITAGFPATTATSVAAIGTGLPAGQHGIVGFSFAIPDGSLINALSWRTHDGGEGTDLRKRFIPEDIQPVCTALERAADAGVRVTIAVPHPLQGTGLTRAVLRGGRYGAGSLPWRLQLAHVDRLAAAIAERLPPDAQLVVTADHGMVTVPEQSRLDFDTEPTLQAGVRLLGGEPRARYVYTEPGATDDVLRTWRELIGDRAWIVTRDEAIAQGWFGPVVEDRIRDRIGDVVVAARADFGVMRSVVEARSSRLIGHHGSLTAAEQLVPLLVFSPQS